MIINDSHNSRLDLYAERVMRGDILDREGEVIATSTINMNGSESRNYPFGNLFAHAVGYLNNGKGGLESQYNYNLLQSHQFFVLQIVNDLMNRKSNGDSVVTTLDYDVQLAASYALGSQNGAVVVLEPETGKILAMVSKPDFDPNTLGLYWDSYTNDSDNSVLLNRVTSGLYPPGSTFKIFTTLEYIHENPNYSSYEYICNGTMQEGEEQIHCYHNNSHGQEDLMDSFAHSCNTSYANIGLGLDIGQYQTLMDAMLFNRKLPTKLQSTAQSSFSLSGEDSQGTIMRTAIGQGNTVVTPLHMAMIAGAICNKGILMEPYMVDHTENDMGIMVKEFHETEYGAVMSVEDARLLEDYMSGVVSYGTATSLAGNGYSAYGKTGSAEYNSAGNSHGWFVGYARKDGFPDIAIAVIVEDGDSGSSSAVPVAKQVFQAYFSDLFED